MKRDSPEDEKDRLEALNRYGVLDTPPDQAFDAITRLASRFFEVPICLISLVDEDRIWFKSIQGLDAEEVGRAPGLCASVILSDEAHIIENAIDDPRTLANPLVAGELGLRFYAGIPLKTHDGFRLGSMAIIDFEPRMLSDEEVGDLEDFAGLVMDEMELRLSARSTVHSLRKLLVLAREGAEWEDFVTICAWSNRIKVGEKWISYDDFLRDHLGMSVSHGIHPDVVQKLKENEDH